MKCLRIKARKTRRGRVRNERIREELLLSSMSKRIEDRQISWFGHIMRLDVDSKLGQFMEKKPLGQKIPVERQELLGKKGLN
ncbi:hypothetical protein ANN_01891 [Periplaneta americana]|uniref:Uncharacterized protein n=1 Tax=Periplaneta americana TaxID=6978 RepID=A0ABQ8TX62_PERAM|nr:hypothetical protein ANN_01891 [Periplaneta americana]